MKTLEQRVKALEQQALSAVRVSPGGGAIATARLSVGSGASIQQINRYTFNWAPGNVPANSIWNLSLGISSLTVNDWVYVIPPGISNCPPCSAVVTGPGTLSILYVNPYTTPQAPATGIYTVVAIRV